QDLTLAIVLLKEAESIALQLLKQNPSNDRWKAALADVEVRLGSAESELHMSSEAEKLSANGLATLKDLAAKQPESVSTIDYEVAALLTVKPLTLRDPKLAIESAEREAALTRRREPGVLLSVAQAYRSAGQIEHARATANEGLALLPPVRPGTPISRTRKLLESE